MTVSTTASSITHPGNGATTSWSYNFIIPTADDVEVWTTVVATDEVTVLTPAEYTITGLDNEAGGTVEYPLSGTPVPSGTSLTIARAVPYTQIYQFSNQDRLWAEKLEAALDRMEMQIQQLGDNATIEAIQALIEEFILDYGGVDVVGGEVMLSRANLQAVNTLFPASVTAVWVLGYASGTSGPAMKFKKLSGAPTTVTAAHVQTVAGEWFELDMPIVTVAMCGGNTNDTVTAANFINKPMIIPAGATATLTITPTTASTDTTRNAVMQDAITWFGSCIQGNNSISIINVSETGGIDVQGQLTFEDPSTGSSSPGILRFQMPATYTVAGVEPQITAIDFESVVSGTSVIAAPAYGGLVAASMNNLGTGYAGPSFNVPVTASKAGTGTVATAYTSGGVITALVIDDPGTGWVAGETATFDFTGGGGSNASVAAYIVNPNVVPVTITLDAALPSNIAVGMPFGIRGATGDDGGTNTDGGAINGAFIVTAFDSTNRRVSFNLTSIAGAQVDCSGGIAGAVTFPGAWINVRGGYEGGSREGYMNVGHGTEVQFARTFVCFDPSATDYPYKTNQKGLWSGALGGRVHTFSGVTAFVGFPHSQIRFVQAGPSYLNRIRLGGGILGGTGLTVQNGGSCQVASGAIGGLRTNGALAGMGCYVQLGGTDFGACGTGVAAPGGIISYETCNLTGCETGAEATLGGVASGEATATLKRCKTGVSYNLGGRVIQLASLVTNSRTAAGTTDSNYWARGGWWASGTGTTILRRRHLINTGAKAGATAGWTVGGGAVDTGTIATMAAGGTAATLVVPVPFLDIGDSILSWSLVGQMDSAGNAVTLDASLRKMTASASGVADALVGPAMTQINVTADTLVSQVNSATTLSSAEDVADGESFYFLITGTTGAATTITLTGIEIYTGQ